MPEIEEAVLPAYSYDRPDASSYLFIDGANLTEIIRRVSDRYFVGVRPELDWAMVRQDCRKVFYYDAIPVRKEDENTDVYEARIADKKAELAMIETQPGFHVRTGDVRHRRKRGNEQKMVDVHLAVDALLMASRGLFGKILLLTGDLDFKPLIDALVDLGIDVHLRYPQNETSPELIAAADQAEPVTLLNVMGWIASSSPLKKIIPVSSLEFPGAERGYPLYKWDDENYGPCSIFPRDNGSSVELVGSKPPRHPAHCLSVRGRDIDIVRLYCEDVHDLQVPIWP